MQQRITTKLRANSSSNSSSFETVNRSIATLTVILTPAAVVFALIMHGFTRDKIQGTQRKTDSIRKQG